MRRVQNKALKWWIGWDWKEEGKLVPVENGWLKKQRDRVKTGLIQKVLWNELNDLQKRDWDGVKGGGKFLNANEGEYFQR